MWHRCGLFVFTFLLLTFSKPHAQSLFQKPSFGVQGYYGSFLTRIPKAQYLRDSYTYFGEITVQQQTDGRKAWQVANGLPRVGVALFYGNTGSKQYMGNMAGLFPFVHWTLYKTKNIRSGLRTGAGLGWIQKPYDRLTNHKAVLIGTHLNAYLNFSWQAEVRLFSNLHVAAGIAFSHFSNSSSTLPNLGLNIPTLSAGLRYQRGRNIPSQKRVPDTAHKKSSVTLSTTVGIKQYPWIESRRYAVNTLLAEWSRPFWACGTYGGGAALFYDRALEVNPLGILDQKRQGSKLQAGVFAGYEHRFGRLSVPLQVGVYIYNRGFNIMPFQQLGFRYRIHPHWSALLLMKTHAGKADYIHAGFSYRIK